jgi:hypothetical protein
LAALSGVLLLVVLGSIVSLIAGLLASVDHNEERFGDAVSPSGSSARYELLDTLCMLQVWFYGIGFNISFGALFYKVWRLFQKRRDADEEETPGTLLEAIRCSWWILVLELVLLGSWTATSSAQLEYSVNTKFDEQVRDCTLARRSALSLGANF